MPNHKEYLVTQAKSRIASWFDSAQYDKAVRRKLIRGVDAVAKELSQRDDWYEVMTVGVDDGGDVPIRIERERYFAYPAGTSLAVSTVLPGWAFGWRSILKNEDVYEILTWLLHFARQYIHRSYVARVLMLAWEMTSKVLHPFGSWSAYQRYGPMQPARPLNEMLTRARRIALADAVDSMKVDRIPFTMSDWVDSNTLDPHLHQSIFYFLRAQNLSSNAFGVEAVVDLDCAIQSIVALVEDRVRPATAITRIQLCDHLGLSDRSSEEFEYLQFMRNNFGAHAGGWRWWDADETLDEESIETMSSVVKEAISAASRWEQTNRKIDPAPGDWGEWFFLQFETLWDSVWFERLDRWSHGRAGA